MPKVYVVQDSGKNLVPAREFGEIEICSHARDDMQIAKNRISDRLMNFENGDMLLLIGHPILIGLAMHQLLLRFGRLPCLVWDRDHYRYNIENVEFELI
jgi:hypothetical protein